MSRECKDCVYATPDPDFPPGGKEWWDFATCTKWPGEHFCSAQRLRLPAKGHPNHCHPEGRFFEPREATGNAGTTNFCSHVPQEQAPCPACLGVEDPSSSIAGHRSEAVAPQGAQVGGHGGVAGPVSSSIPSGPASIDHPIAPIDPTERQRSIGDPAPADWSIVETTYPAGLPIDGPVAFIADPSEPPRYGFIDGEWVLLPRRGGA